MDQRPITVTIGDVNAGPGARIVAGISGVDASFAHDRQSANSHDLDANHDFLSTLSAINPESQKEWIDKLFKDSASNAFEPLLNEDRPLGQWLSGKTTTSQLLWIRDKTGKGHSLLIAKIIEGMVTQAKRIVAAHTVAHGGFSMSEETIAVSYFFCRSHEQECRTASEVLRGLLYHLLLKRPSLLSSIRKENAQDVRNLRGTPWELPVLSKILRATLDNIAQQGSRIVLIVEGLDECASNTDNSGPADVFDILKEIAMTTGKLKIIFSGRSTFGLSQIPATNAKSWLFDLKAADVASALALDEAIKMIQNGAETMTRLKETLRDNHKANLEGLSWFSYCKAGRSWLQSQHPVGLTGPRIMWYQRTEQGLLTPSSVAVHTADLAHPFTNSTPSTAYFSFSSTIRDDVETSDIEKVKFHPSLALWCLFVQLMQEASLLVDSWAALLLNFPTQVHKDLKTITGRLASKETTKNGAQVLDTKTIKDDDIIIRRYTKQWYQDMGVFGRNDNETLVELLATTLESLPRDYFLIFDCLEFTEAEFWDPILKVLQQRLPTRAHILLCGPDDFVNKNARLSSQSWSIVNDELEYEECLQNLHFTDIHTRREQIADAAIETNGWIWSNDTFSKWEKSGGLLWISGKPGSGKSVLAKSIQRHFKDCSAGKPNIQSWCMCDWFYSDRGGEVGMGHDFMLRALLYEILHQSRPLYEAVKQRYRAVFDHDPAQFSWSITALGDMLQCLSTSSHTPDTLLVIDAMDESADSDNTAGSRSAVLDILRGIADVISGRIRLIVLSRPEPHIHNRLRRYLRITMEDHNQRDIHKVVENGLDSIRDSWRDTDAVNSFGESSSEDSDYGIENDMCPSITHRNMDTEVNNTEAMDMEESELNDIRRYLNENASGVILWVSLVLQQIQYYVESEDGFTFQGLSDLVRKIPRGVDELYAHIVSGLGLWENPEKLKISKTIFTWIIGSRKWASLELQQLREAIAIPDDSLERNRSQKPAMARRRFVIRKKRGWEAFSHLIYRHCGPLVAVYKSERHDSSATKNSSNVVEATWTLQLVHQTVKTFLEDKAKSGMLHITLEDAESHVISGSYRYLGFNVPAQPASSLRHIGEQLRSSQGPYRRDILRGHPNAMTEIMHQSRLNLVSTDFHLEMSESCLAVRDYCEARPLAPLALWIVHNTLLADDEVLITSMQEEDIVIGVNECYILYWFMDAFHFSPGKSSNVQYFIHHCCQNGEVEMLEAMTTLSIQYRAKYQFLDGVSSFYHESDTIIGALRVFLEVEAEHDHCELPVADDLYEVYRYYYEACVLDEVSDMAVTTINKLYLQASYSSPGQNTGPEDDLMEQLVNVNEVQARKRNRPNETASRSYQARTYSNYFRHQTHVGRVYSGYRSHVEETYGERPDHVLERQAKPVPVPIWRIHDAIEVLVKWLNLIRTTKEHTESWNLRRWEHHNTEISFLRAILGDESSDVNIASGPGGDLPSLFDNFGESTSSAAIMLPDSGPPWPPGTQAVQQGNTAVPENYFVGMAEVGSLSSPDSVNR